MTIILPHIPKAGGTSVRKHLDASGCSVFLDYDALPGHQPWQVANEKRRNAEFAKLDFNPFDVVFGHFPIDRYVGRNYAYAALVRDPLERCKSHYLFQRARAVAALDVTKAQQDGMNIVAGQTFVEYVSHKLPQSVYWKYLHYWPREKFALIGTIDAMPKFLAGLSELLGCDLPGSIHERKRDGDLDLTADEIAEARHCLRAEYDWYTAFVAG